ncbi:hypothetical protein D7Y15_11600 [Corallococcus sp. AB030]|uniref:hypothetical protein n=1 Tax=unclassified Corallococcus TaxID=2685029 RepID=UPI000EA0B990|nr:MULTISPECIES: hypothetical protein [unclassified Corallococcus]RKH21478.1 hypothetical protein D7V77_29320 [Corallococcus sp. CA041A]RKI16696.1 hypothetical protein D7Y15_11600 [Corallococcus sp. AB030]
MTASEKFEMESTLKILDAVSKSHPPGSKEEAAVQLAAVALLYLRRIKKLDGFLEYHQEFSDSSVHVPIARDFATQTDADSWLASGEAVDGAIVRIDGWGFQVIQLPKGLKFLRTPLPDELGPPGPK